MEAGRALGGLLSTRATGERATLCRAAAAGVCAAAAALCNGLAGQLVWEGAVLCWPQHRQLPGFSWPAVC